MRTVAEQLEKAEAFDQLAASAKNDLLRTSYLDIARTYRDLAKQRSFMLSDVAAGAMDAHAGRVDGVILRKLNGAS